MYIRLLQIEIIGPQGDKLVWVFLFVALIVALVFFFNKKRTFAWPSLINRVLVSIEKNKVYHPTTIQLKVVNKTAKAIVIENPIIRFKRGKTTSAYKIKKVNAKNIYPLYLEPAKTHLLPVDLDPFFEYNPKLKKFNRLRIEFTYNQNKQKSSNYLLLRPTLFRSES